MMKLSEAMRLGAMLRPQVKFERHSSFGSCALGAAEDAIGSSGSYGRLPFELLVAEHHWPILLTCQRNPVTGDAWPMNVIVAQLNNGNYGNHGEPWTRERIADWVEGIEREQESAATVKAEPELVHQL
jgi:hypothetical protein